MTNPANIGQQFLDRSQRLFARLRERPVSDDPNAKGYAVRTGTHTMSTFNPQNKYAVLYHDGESVGKVSWVPDTGFVKILDVAKEHRHMTAKLLQESWDYATSTGDYGPAWSHDLNNASSRIMERHNPESEGLKGYRERRQQ
jgi:hypothetical protein